MFSLSEKVTQAIAGVMFAIMAVAILWASYGRHMAEQELAATQVKLYAALADAANLRASVATQNAALDAANTAAQAAQARAQAAMDIAKAQGVRAGQVLDVLKAAKAQTCTQAMPFVRKALEGLQ